MKNRTLFFLSLFLTLTAFGETFIFDNETGYPSGTTPSKIAIQWAASGKDIDEGNAAVLHQSPLNSTTMQPIQTTGIMTLTIPSEAKYFRILVWSTGTGNPDLLTNWIDLTPNKTYTLTAKQLTPAVLMSGMGC